jgi:hypothetical protein
MTRRNIIFCAVRSYLSRRIRLDSQGMNVRLHEGAQGVVHHPVAPDGRLAGKGFSHHGYPEMSAAVPGPGMAGMKMALILDFEQFRLEGIQQALPDDLNSLFVQLIHPFGKRRLG